MIYEKRGRWVWETGTGRRKFSIFWYAFSFSSFYHSLMHI